MAKQPTTSPQDATPESAPRMSLNDFCARLSETVRRPELIGGFEFTERTSGRVADTEAAFRSRFDAFLNKPI